MSRFLRKLIFFLVCLLFLQASYLPYLDNYQLENVVKDLLQTKESAVRERDLERFLSVIDSNNPFYVQEQKRWFVDAIKVIEPASYRLELLRIDQKQKNQLHIMVRQSYQQNGKRYVVQFPLLIRKTQAGWRESDLAFKQLKSDPIQVFYTIPALEESAYIALDIVKRALRVMKERNHWITKRVEVKLYHDPEVFRQSVKPSLPFWTGGWHEARQSIKMVVTHQQPKWLASGLIHELAHQMVSELTNDNAAYWLQEGAAMYYEAHLLPGLHEDLPSEEDQPAKYSLSELKKMNLEKLPDKEAAQYYWSCYRLFRFLVEEYGEEKIRSVFAVLKKYPYLDQDTIEKKEVINQRTEEAIRKGLAITEKQLEQKWRKKRGESY